MNNLWLNKTLAQTLPAQAKEVLDKAALMEGETVRQVNIRHTYRTTIEGKSYFVKYHGGISLNDIIGDLLRLRKPVIGAHNEYLRTQQLSALGLHVPTLAGFAKQGYGLINHRSCLITEDLGDTITLNELSREWQTNPPSVKDKRLLIKNIALVIRAIHQAGIVHRDLYLSHFRIRKQELDKKDFANLPLYVMDLHRALQWPQISARWLSKDLGALYFSTLPYNFSQRDIFRFLKTYYAEPSLRKILSSHQDLLKRADTKAQAIYQRQQRKQSQGTV